MDWQRRSNVVRLHWRINYATKAKCVTTYCDAFASHYSRLDNCCNCDVPTTHRAKQDCFGYCSWSTYAGSRDSTIKAFRRIVRALPSLYFTVSYQRCIPSWHSRVRQERKVRPGFTPQEDVTIFRGSKQQQMDRNALPKGHILGWVAPTAATSAPKKTAAGKDGAVLSKSAKKNEKRREKKREEKEKIIRENWEESDEEVRPTKPSNKGSGPANTELGSNIGAQQEMDNLAEQLASTGLNQPWSNIPGWLGLAAVPGLPVLTVLPPNPWRSTWDFDPTIASCV